MKKYLWFVSTSTEFIRMTGKREAMRVANVKSGDLFRECGCGCGEPAAKPYRRHMAQP